MLFVTEQPKQSLFCSTTTSSSHWISADPSSLRLPACSPEQKVEEKFCSDRSTSWAEASPRRRGSSAASDWTNNLALCWSASWLRSSLRDRAAVRRERWPGQSRGVCCSSSTRDTLSDPMSDTSERPESFSAAMEYWSHESNSVRDKSCSSMLQDNQSHEWNSEELVFNTLRKTDAIKTNHQPAWVWLVSYSGSWKWS